MANLCSFALRVHGKKENVETLYNWLSATYDYSEENKGIQVWRVPEGKDPWAVIDEADKIPEEHHIGYRVSGAYKGSDFEDYSGEYFMSISGDCAWSVYSCMFSDNGLGTYMGDKEYGRETDKAISITDASKELNLEIEIFSEEPGCEFSEHYYIKNGEVLENSQTEFYDLTLCYYDKNAEEYIEDEYNALPSNIKYLVDEALKEGKDNLIVCDNINDFGDYCWEYIKY